MAQVTTSREQALAPEYTTTTIGPPDFLNIANRLRSIAAFLAAQGQTEAAEHAARASGSLLASIAAK